MDKKAIAFGLFVALSSHVMASDENFIPTEETTITEMTEKEKWTFIKKTIIDPTEEETKRLFSRIAIGSLVSSAAVTVPLLILAGIAKLSQQRQRNRQVIRAQRADNNQEIDVVIPGGPTYTAELIALSGTALGLMCAPMGALMGYEFHVSKKRAHFTDYVINWETYQHKTPKELCPIFEEAFQIYKKLAAMQEGDSSDPHQVLVRKYLEKLFTCKYKIVKQLIEAQNI